MYKLKKSLGKGSFGEVFLATDISSGNDIACKVEAIGEKSRLIHEYHVYMLLASKGILHIPKVHNLHTIKDKYNIMSMELLGPTLDNIFNDNDKKMDLDTVFYIAIKLIQIIRDIHEAGIIHRDIKPSNFTIGVNNRSDIYIIDFGLSKKYMNSKNIHMPLLTRNSMIGTARYVSVNVHLGLSPSRRDDLESIMYMLIYFIKGTLPWQGLKKRGTNDVICEKKICTTTTELTVGLPKCFKTYLDYCRKLGFSDIPDYESLIKLFTNTVGNRVITPCWIRTTNN